MSEPGRNWRDIRDDFLSYTRAERNGIILLIALIVLVNAWNLYDRYFRIQTYDYTEALAEIEAAYAVDEVLNVEAKTLFPFDPNTVTEEEMLQLGFAQWKIKTFMKYRVTGAKFRSVNDFAKVYSIDSVDISRVKDFIVFNKPKAATLKKPIAKNSVKVSTTPLFDFDPNTASKSELKSLGLSDRVIKTIENFRRKGAFRKPSDVSKIYGLEKSTFEKLLPFIKIEKKEKENDIAYKNQNINKLDTFGKSEYKPRKKIEEVALASIDINTATVEEWQRINGIGPTFAGRIVKFRDKLGGFYAVEQIAETYGIVDSVYQKIVPFVKVSAPKNKIKINTVIVDSLAGHPYFSWSQSRVIVNYRKKHGPFLSSEDVYKCKRFTEEEWQRLIPYFDYAVGLDTLAQ